MKFYQLASLALGCLLALPASAQLAQREERVVYGNDNRIDYYQVEDAAQRTTGVRSVAGVMSAYSIDASDSARARFRATTLGKAASLCEGQRFRDQKIPAFCSGVLIGPDLMLTAGHCVWDAENQCPNLRFVFDYHLGASSEVEPSSVARSDIYSCQQVLVREQSSSGGRTQDWAVIQLDRPVDSQRTPATIRSATGALAVNTEVLMIGAPNGLPTKWDAGGRVLNANASTLDTFSASVDAFGGNSGSGVWTKDGSELLGILVSGLTDYKQQGQCNVVNTCAEGACNGENIVYIHNVVDALCAKIQHPTLCGTSAKCGDGYCASSESATSCPADCQPVVCGDDYCASEEWDACPQDCVKTVPSTWTCDAWDYGSFNGCNNNCGARDPDCDIKSPNSSLSDLLCQSAGPGPFLAMLASIFGILGAFAYRSRRRARG